jgi:hypothetical protein
MVTDFQTKFKHAFILITYYNIPIYHAYHDNIRIFIVSIRCDVLLVSYNHFSSTSQDMHILNFNGQ